MVSFYIGVFGLVLTLFIYLRNRPATVVVRGISRFFPTTEVSVETQCSTSSLDSLSEIAPRQNPYLGGHRGCTVA